MVSIEQQQQQRHNKFVPFIGEDEPFYKYATIIPYYFNKESNLIQVYLRESNDILEGFLGTIKENEASIIYTIARVLLLQSCNYFPKQEIKYMKGYKDQIELTLIASPLTDRIVKTIVEDDRCFKDIKPGKWTVWYPLDKQIDDSELQDINEHLQRFNQSCLKVVTLDSDGTYSAGNIEESMKEIITMSDQSLIERLITIQSQPLPVTHAVIQEEESVLFHSIYHSAFVGQYMQSSDKWQCYNSYLNVFPTDHDLSTIKVLVFPGSAFSVYDEKNKFVEKVGEFIRKVYNEYPHIKMFGSCFGHQIIAHSLGGRCSKMLDLPKDRAKIVGRELIQLTDGFFKLSYVQRALEKQGLTRETMPPLVLQQSHGDHVSIMPTDAVLLGKSDSCDIEMYGIDERVFCLQSHPDFNQSIQEELDVGEYYLFGVLNWETTARSFMESGTLKFGKESRNFMHSVIREFLKM